MQLLAKTLSQRQTSTVILLLNIWLDISLLLDPSIIDIETLTAPIHAKSLANVKWESGTMIAPSGGVSILASEAFREDMRLPLSAEFEALLKQDQSTIKPDQWWWD